MTVVVGTAGHIDHGKTTLLRALTGIDADRLPEERRRGMTIEVGYAHLRLPDGDVLDFVDVPGHDRLVGNMLVGAGEIDAVLLVVAADDGPRAQTREHVELLDALGLRHAVVAVTKADAVDGARVAEVRDAVEATPRADDVRRGAGRRRVGRDRRGTGRARGGARRAPRSCPGRRGRGAGAGAPGGRPRLRREGSGHGGHRHAARWAAGARGVAAPGAGRRPPCACPGAAGARARRSRPADPGGRLAANVAGVERGRSRGRRAHRRPGCRRRPTASSSRCGRRSTSPPAGGAGVRSPAGLRRPAPPRDGAGRAVSCGDRGATSTTCRTGEATAILRLAVPVAAAPGDRFVPPAAVARGAARRWSRAGSPASLGRRVATRHGGGRERPGPGGHPRRSAASPFSSCTGRSAGVTRRSDRCPRARRWRPAASSSPRASRPPSSRRRSRSSSRRPATGSRSPSCGDGWGVPSADARRSTRTRPPTLAAR